MSSTMLTKQLVTVMVYNLSFSLGSGIKKGGYCVPSLLLSLRNSKVIDLRPASSVAMQVSFVLFFTFFADELLLFAPEKNTGTVQRFLGAEYNLWHPPN